jgi:hypothetical protein
MRGEYFRGRWGCECHRSNTARLLAWFIRFKRGAARLDWCGIGLGMHIPLPFTKTCARCMYIYKEEKNWVGPMQPVERTIWKASQISHGQSIHQLQHQLNHLGVSYH